MDRMEWRFFVDGEVVGPVTQLCTSHLNIQERVRLRGLKMKKFGTVAIAIFFTDELSLWPVNL